ncbi:DNA cytosine methyltransferase [Kosakonia radicincitans]|uniref:DNA cytosine methyltransferase n=1 Tax=Kosakonia radicincitans TaxID=283686 RepID=UPI0011EDB1E4|nr:DNA cytosine methyltransferase [Kosakonia radicincitans]QEM89179.1 DNA cytosine methyltransferase [Kosakonia radicincitans]
MALTAIDLFCGAGGLTCGLKQAGFDVRLGVELEHVAAITYRKNHPEHSLREADIRDLDPFELMSEMNFKPGDLDLLAGCPPCQGFSSHRTRNKTTSIDDHRNDLIFELIRFVKAFEPKVIMIENVPALAKDNRIKCVLNELCNMGYKVGPQSLQVKNTALYGVPQRRKRMILVVSRFGDISEPEIIKPQSTVKDAIFNFPRPENSTDTLHNIIERRAERIKKMISLVPKNGGSRSDLPIEYWLPCHVRNPNCYRDVYGRMSWDDVAPTITGGCINPSKGRFLHPEQDRAITLREAAVLQTFPVDYYFSLQKGRDFAALMIGNALPPSFIRAHALKIKEHIESLIF